jgi:hypothetical protein
MLDRPFSWRHTTVLVGTLLGLSLPLVSCGRESGPTEEPRTFKVDRQAKPEIIMRKHDLYFDGWQLELGRTTATELKARLKHDFSTQAGADAYWNKTGIVIHSDVDDDKPGKPEVVHRFVVWLRHDSQDRDINKPRPCTPAGVKRHEESVKDRLKSIENEEREQRWPRNNEVRAELLSEKCIDYANTPDNLFTGYLEIDGMAITSDMTLRDIQALRKKMKLLPLKMIKVAGPRHYAAVTGSNVPTGDRYQVWEFEWPPEEGVDPENLRIKMISLP